MWRDVLFLLCLAAGSGQISITEILVPAAIEAGENASLQCRYDLNESEVNLFVKWWWTPNDNRDQRYQLYQRRVGDNPVVIQHTDHNIEIDENDGIKLLNVTPEDSGNYECEVSNVINEDRKHKKLIVFSIGSGPLLNVSVVENNSGDEQGTVLAACEAFNVAPFPNISITLNGEAVESSGIVSQLDHGLFHIQENATLPVDEADNGEFQCEIFFDDTDIPHAPYVTSQTYNVPTASTTESEEPATEPPAAAAEPNDNGSIRIGNSMGLMLLTSFYSYTII